MEPEKSSLPQIVLDYVESVTRKVKHSPKVRHDVRAELLAHFEDALRGVQDRANRQKKAEELIREFGEVKLLAVLIRRGKKRCRPMWQKAMIRGFQAVGAMVLLLVLYVGWFFTGKPVITTNYVDKLNQWVRPVADENQNARPFYEEAAAEYKKPDVPDANDFKLSPQKLTDLDASQRRIVEKWIADNQKAIELIRQGNQKPYYWRVYSVEKSEQSNVPEMIALLIPDLSKYKKLAQLVCWEAYQEAQKGNTEKAMNDLTDVYDFGRHIRMQNGGALVEQLTGFGVESMACQGMIGLLSEGAVDINVLASVQERFAAIRMQESFTVDFQSERLFLYDEIQRCYAHSRIGKDHLYLQRLEKLNSNIKWEKLFTTKGAKAGVWVLFSHPGREETFNSANRLYTLYDELAITTPAASRIKLSELQQQAERIIEGNIILGSLVPALEKVCEYSWQVRTSCLAANTIMSLQRYKNEKHHYPAALEILVDEGYLEKIPIDPYSNKPLIYRLDSDNFTLYSIGPDFKDDGGRAGERSRKGKLDFWAQNGGDVVFWPMHKEEPVKSQSPGKN